MPIYHMYDLHDMSVRRALIEAGVTRFNNGSFLLKDGRRVENPLAENRSMSVAASRQRLDALKREIT